MQYSQVPNKLGGGGWGQNKRGGWKNFQNLINGRVEINGGSEIEKTA